MPTVVPDDLLARCDHTLLVTTFGLVTRVNVAAADVDEVRFHFDTLDRAPVVHAQAWLHADGGYFHSLLAKDGALKTMALLDTATGTVTVKRFRSWSGTPAFVPPFATTAFTDNHLLVPGDVVSSPDARTTVLITGEPHVGKTALGTALFERGWSHVSAQLAVLHRPDLTVAPQRRTVGLRRATLARHRDTLRGMPTRSLISEATGEVVLAHVRDLFPHMPPPAPGSRITDHLRLVPTSPTPSPAEATRRAVAHCYPTTARADAARALDVSTDVVAVPTLESIAALADDMTKRAARA